MSKDFNYVVVDTETSGLSPKYSEIVEIGFQVLNAETFQPIETWSSLIRPTRSKIMTEHITGIGDVMVRNAPTFNDVAEFLAGKFHGHKLVAHNGKNFDAKFIQAGFETTDWFVDHLAMVDTLALSRKFLSLPSHKQASIAAHYRVPVSNAHRVDGDVEVLAQIFTRMMEDSRVRQETYRNHSRLSSISQLVAPF